MKHIIHYTSTEKKRTVWSLWTCCGADAMFHRTYF